MNARQMKKCLKKQIEKLQSDNNLMKRIIADRPQMQKLYDDYNKPVKVIHATIPFHEFKVERMEYVADDEEAIEQMKQSIAEELTEGIKENIVYEISNNKYGLTSITGSIFIGTK